MDAARKSTIASRVKAAAAEQWTGDRFVVLLAASMISGITLFAWENYVMCGVLAAALLGFCIGKKTRRRAIALLAFFALGVGVCRLALLPLDLARRTVSGEEIELSAVVTQIEVQEDDRARAKIERVTVNGARLRGAYSLWLDEDAPELHVGQTIRCRCAQKVKRSYHNPGSRLTALSNARYHGLIYFSNAEQLKTEDAALDLPLRVRLRIEGFLQRVRERIKRALFENVPEENCAALSYGMLVGDSSYVDDETYAVFRDGGILHLLAVSGLHIGATAAALAFLLRRLPLPLFARGLLSVSVIGFYVLVCGASPSAQRAAILFSIMTFAPMGRKKADGLCSLAAAAIVILSFDPLAVFSAGFRLSFAAAGTIALIGRDVSRVLTRALQKIRLPFAKAVGTTVGVSLSAQLGVTPCMLCIFGSTPLSSLLLNPIVVPLAGLLLCSCWLTVALDIVGVLAPFFGKITGALFSAVLWLTRLFSKLLPDFAAPFWLPVWLRILFFVVLFAFSSYFLWHGKKRRAVQSVLCAALAVSCFVCFWCSRASEGVYLFDVGQGQCALVKTAGKNILVDCGTDVYGGVSQRELTGALLRCGVGRIDAMILSHSDGDHTKLADAIGENLQIETVVCGEETAETLKLSDICSPKELEDLFPNGEVRLLHGSGGEENDDSLVLKIRVSDQTVLFPGDASADVLERLADDVLLSDVLIVAHHGGENSVSTELLARVRPETALISAGRNNRYGHPTKETTALLERAGIDTFCTKECGALLVSRDGVFGYDTHGGFRKADDR